MTRTTECMLGDSKPSTDTSLRHLYKVVSFVQLCTVDIDLPKRTSALSLAEDIAAKNGYHSLYVYGHPGLPERLAVQLSASTGNRQSELPNTQRPSGCLELQVTPPPINQPPHNHKPPTSSKSCTTPYNESRSDHGSRTREHLLHPHRDARMDQSEPRISWALAGPTSGLLLIHPYAAELT